MGFALAEECARRGAIVTLISGPVVIECSNKVKRIDVESCEQMHEAAVREFKDQDAAILCAAVADFKPENIAEKKIKRGKEDLVLRLLPTQDIAASLGRLKKSGQKLVGFALETNDEETNAVKKLHKKNFDFIVLNSTRNKGTTFQSDFNKISIISENEKKDFAKKPKDEVAKDIIDEMELLFES